MVIPTNSKLWLKAVLSAQATIKQAIANLNESTLKIIMVVDSSGALIGTITDGDIRRGLLNGIELHNSIELVINCSPIVVPPNFERKTVVQIMAANKVQQIPIVDDSRVVVGLHLWDEITVKPTRDNVMIIMAGGRGSRLHPYTESCPKPLLPLAGKPMLEHIIERAKLEGFNKFIISVHHLGNMIKEYFGNGVSTGVDILYLDEEFPMGTAGALSLLNPHPKLPFVVTNGDVISDISYGEILDFHERQNSIATMAIRAYELQNPFGIVKINGVNIVGFEEKPIYRNHINAGIYVLSPDAINYLNSNEACDMPTLFIRLRKNMKKIVAYPMHEPWLDVGRPDDLNAAQEKLSKEI